MREHPLVKYLHVEQNLGIIGGMHLATQHATGRYIVPVDSDDYLYPDTVSIITSMIQTQQLSAVAVLGRRPFAGEPLDGAVFQAGLGSGLVSELVLYRTFVRHRSTNGRVSGNLHRPGNQRISRLGYVHAVRQRRSYPRTRSRSAVQLACTPIQPQATSRPRIISIRRSTRCSSDTSSRCPRELYSVELSPLFKGTPDWRFMRQKHSSCPLTVIVLGGSTRSNHRHKVLESFDWPGHVAVGFPLHGGLRDLARVVARHAPRDGLVAFVSEEIEIQHPEWAWQALSLTELHSDLAIVGGRICRPDGVVMDAGRYFGYGRGCDCPDRGRPIAHVGYHAQMFKERSVDAVPLQLCVYKTEFLSELLANRRLRNHATLFSLPMWAGAAARRSGAQVAYSPFLTATTSEDWLLRISEEDQRDFVRHNVDVLSETKYYSVHCDVTGARAYEEATMQARQSHLDSQLLLCGIHPEAVERRAARRPSDLSNVRVA